MATISTDFLYLLDQSGSSDNGKVVRELVPNSTAISTEQTNDNVLVVGEQFTVNFTNSDVETKYGSFTFTYIGTDQNTPGAVALGSDNNFYLFSNDGTIDIGTNLNKIQAIDIPLCFMAGTMIKTPTGEVSVETLKIGDQILTLTGQTISVKWIGKQIIDTFFGLPIAHIPVSIAIGALGKNQPKRELCLTSNHAILIDNILIQAGALVNGTTIKRIIPSGRFTVYHIETENHEIILAEDVPVETFIDNVTRESFNNYDEFVILFGSEPKPIEELPYPRAKSSRQIPLSIRATLTLRELNAQKTQKP